MEYLGHRYVVRNRRRGWTYYSCKFRVQFNCHGSLKVQGGVIEITREHNGHDIPGVAIEIFRRALVQRALHDRTSLRVIYDEEAARNPEAAVLYPYPTAYSCMQSTRRRNNPPIPPTLFELGRLIGSEEWAHIFSIDLEDGPEPFFRRTIQTEEGTALFFSAQSFLDVAVAGVEEMHLDGTFKCIPAAPPSHQLLTIHIIKYEKSIALAYVLMSCRRQGLYRAVLEVLQEFAPTLQPLLIITDYERALRGSLMEMFPAAEVVGCFFHYASAVWKMCATLGYLVEYRNNEYMKKAIKMTMALPLLPQDAIEAGLEAVMAWCNDRGINLRNFFAYIQRFWIRSVTPAGMSVFGLPRRTNNNVEAYNKIILAKMGVHPNVFVFLEKLCQLQKRAMLDIRTLENGLRVTRSVRELYLAQDVRVRDAQQAWLEGVYTTIQFLEIMAHSVDRIAEDMHQGHLLNIRDENVIDVDELPPLVPEEHVPAPQDVVQAPLIGQAPQVEPPEILAPQEEIQQEQPPAPAGVCVVCQVALPTHACAPCGHKCLCRACSNELIARQTMTCPTCRAEVLFYMEVF